MGAPLTYTVNSIGSATDRVDILDRNHDEISLLAHLARYAFVVRQLTPDDTVLEVGSGTGYGAHFISKHVSHVIAFEPFVDPKSLTTVWNRDNLEFTQEIVSKSGFDKIVALEVIEHMPRSEADEFLRFLVERGNERSTWFISTPRRLEDEDRTENRKRAHPYEYSFEDFRLIIGEYFYNFQIYSQNDALISFQNPKMAWNFVAVCTNPKLLRR